MGETRQYINKEDEKGNIHISEDVLAVIAAAATLEVEGVSSLAPSLRSDISEVLGRKNLSKGIRIQTEGEQVLVEVEILVKYGCSIPDVAKAVQESVQSSVENMSSLSVAAVNVNVVGIVTDTAAQKQ